MLLCAHVLIPRVVIPLWVAKAAEEKSGPVLRLQLIIEATGGEIFSKSSCVPWISSVSFFVDIEIYRSLESNRKHTSLRLDEKPLREPRLNR